MRRLLLVPCCLAVTATDPSTPIAIPHEQTEIQGEGLPFDGGVATQTGDAASREKALNSARPGFTQKRIRDTAETSASAHQTYELVLKPKERLEVILKAPGEAEIVLRFLRRTLTDPLAQAVFLANQTPTPVRKRTIRIQNPTDQPQTTLLFLFGKQGFPYTLTLKRTEA